MKYILISLLYISCSSKKPESEPIIYSQNSPEVNTTNPKSPSITAIQIAAEKGSEYVTELKFSKGSSDLNRIDKRKILTTYREAQQEKPIKAIEILTWSDKEYDSSKSLSLKDQRLAKGRIDSIKSYISELDSDLPIKEINMSTKPAKLTGLINTYEAETKKSFEIQESHSGKKSMGIVIFIPEK